MLLHCSFEPTLESRNSISTVTCRAVRLGLRYCNLQRPNPRLCS